MPDNKRQYFICSVGLEPFVILDSVTGELMKSRGYDTIEVRSYHPPPDYPVLISKKDEFSEARIVCIARNRSDTSSKFPVSNSSVLSKIDIYSLGGTSDCILIK